MKRSFSALLLAWVLFPEFAPGQMATHGEYSPRGTGCMRSDNSLFEIFDAGAFDLNGSSVTWSIGPRGGYRVDPGGAFLGFGVGVNVPVGNQQVVGPWPLGFVFPLPGGGSTTAVDLAPAGYVYMDPGTNPDGRCCEGEVARVDFLTASPSFAVFGANLNAGPTGAGAICFDAAILGGRQVAYFTWVDVADGVDPNARNTLQIQFWDDGTCVMSWLQVANPTRSVLVGWSGGGVPGYGEVDLSGLPVVDAPPQTLEPPVLFASTLTPLYPLPLVLRVYRPTISAAALLVGLGQNVVPLDSIGLPRCALYTQVLVAAIPPFILAPSPGLDEAVWCLGSVFPDTPSNYGLEFEAQVTVVGSGMNALGLELTEAASVRLGHIPSPSVPAIQVVADGVSVQPHPITPFWEIRHNDPARPGIRRMTLDFSAAVRGFGMTQSFNTLHPFVNFDGGNSVLPGCAGTYRGTDAVVGLDYTNTVVSTCDPTARTGWIASEPFLPGLFQGYFRKLTFDFTHFDFGEEFGFDCATSGENPEGIGMEGAVITIEFVDGAMVQGELVGNIVQNGNASVQYF